MNAADQFDAPKHTPGPWRLGQVPDTIVSDAPVADGLMSAEAIQYYGGNLICESVAAVNRPLIAASPYLLAELDKAGQIISVLLNELTVGQKWICAGKIKTLGIHGHGMVRAHERDAVLQKAFRVPS